MAWVQLNLKHLLEVLFSNFFLLFLRQILGVPFFFPHPCTPLYHSQVRARYWLISKSCTLLYLHVSYVFSLLIYVGCLPVDQKVWFEFSTRIFQVANKNAFSVTSLKEDNIPRCTQIFLKISYWEFLFHLLFSRNVLRCAVRKFKNFQTELLKTFQGNFCTIRISKFCWMESTWLCLVQNTAIMNCSSLFTSITWLVYIYIVHQTLFQCLLFIACCHKLWQVTHTNSEWPWCSLYLNWPWYQSLRPALLEL